MKTYPYMNALETIIHLKFRKYSNFLRILNLSHLSTSQTPRTFSIHVTPLLNRQLYRASSFAFRQFKRALLHSTWRQLPRGEDLPSPQGLKSGVSHLRNLSHQRLSVLFISCTTPVFAALNSVGVCPKCRLKHTLKYFGLANPVIVEISATVYSDSLSSCPARLRRISSMNSLIDIPVRSVIFW